MNHNFQLTNADTDSIMIHKPNSEYFKKEERIKLLNELNSLSPNGLIWEDDGYYKCVIILKAKNYILQKEDGKITYKGSSIKDQKKEEGLRNFINDVIAILLEDD